LWVTAPMPSDEYSPEEREVLLDVARRSIRHGLDEGDALSINVSNYSPHLGKLGASFITLNRMGELRGCIGTLEAHQPLVQDVAEHAWAAAFRDPRFPPLRQDEFSDLEIHISVLSEPEPIEFQNEADLLEQIQPGTDGLIIEDAGHRGTFLPSVWEQLPHKEDFLAHLKRKAGLSVSHWSDSVKVWRYTTESFE
jgi:AmmeMemoRadiSam system protein A